MNDNRSFGFLYLAENKDISKGVLKLIYKSYNDIRDSVPYLGPLFGHNSNHLKKCIERLV